MPAIEFDPEAWDTERRIMGEFRGYCLGFTFENGDTKDVEYRDLMYVNHEPHYQYQEWDDYTGGGVGDYQLVPVEDVSKVYVY